MHWDDAANIQSSVTLLFIKTINVGEDVNGEHLLLNVRQLHTNFDRYILFAKFIKILIYPSAHDSVTKSASDEIVEIPRFNKYHSILQYYNALTVYY